MIEVKLDSSVLNAFKGDLDNIKKTIDSQDLNIHRAKKYRDFTVDIVKRGETNIKNISWATKFATGEHEPENLTGKLLDQMSVKPSDKKSAEAGYFSNSPIVPNPRGKKKITYTQLAILQHTGCKIPLQGEDGKSIRNALRYYFKINVSPNKQYIIIPPRPFMYRALARYEERDLDTQAVNEFLDQRLPK